MLGEFTPWSELGQHPCIVPRNASGGLDPCLLGRLWRRGPGLGGEGGPVSPPPPAFLANWTAEGSLYDRAAAARRAFGGAKCETFHRLAGTRAPGPGDIETASLGLCF